MSESNGTSSSTEAPAPAPAPAPGTPGAPVAGPRIDDPDFAKAVAMIDAGDVSALRDWLAHHPGLLSERAEEDGGFAGPYFAKPQLLWFIAENPVRRGKLPGNIAGVAQVIIDAANEHDIEGLSSQLNTTLTLVCTGKVPRECGVERELIGVLVKAGADADSAADAALGHGEFDAVRALLDGGATPSLTVAVALDDAELFDQQWPQTQPGADERHRAIAVAVAAQHARLGMLRRLLDAGENPNRFNPDGYHGHSTPAHQASLAGNVEVLKLLVEFGVDLARRDRLWGGTPLDWAHHGEQAEAVAYLEAIESA